MASAYAVRPGRQRAVVALLALSARLTDSTGYRANGHLLCARHWALTAGTPPAAKEEH
jgi:hypothetical protein